MIWYIFDEKYLDYYGNALTVNQQNFHDNLEQIE